MGHIVEDTVRVDVIRQAQRLLLLIVIAGFAAIAVISWQSARVGVGPSWLVRLAGPPQVLGGRYIGIVAGHSGNDSGAVCIDGLTEADVNKDIAERVVRELVRRGATVDLLEEFDKRLAGLRADAFVSIHADSCRDDLGVGFTGFKVASLEGGSAASEQLVKCLWGTYEAATDLKPHEATVTSDMRGYHAFREIAPETPAAIIETGFLKADRALLTEQPDRAAAGIVAGIDCFLNPKE